MHRARQSSCGQPFKAPTEAAAVGVTDQPTPPPLDCSPAPFPDRFGGLHASGSQLMQDDHKMAGSTECCAKAFPVSDEIYAMIERDREGESGAAAYELGSESPTQAGATQHSTTFSVCMPASAESPYCQCSFVERPLGIEVPITTLMVTNIPGRMRQEQVLHIWPPSPWANYNVFYMPYDVVRRRTAGHVFMNFVTQQAAMEFWATWQGQIFPSHHSRSSKSKPAPIDIKIASRQGFDANVASWKFSLSQTTDDAFLPAFFIGGRRYPFWYLVRCMEYVQCERASEVTISSESFSF